MGQCVGAALEAAEKVRARLGLPDARPAEETQPKVVRTNVSLAAQPNHPLHDMALPGDMGQGIARGAGARPGSV